MTPGRRGARLAPRAILGGLLLAPPLAAQSRDAQVAALVERLAPEIVEIRHRIHREPELGNREFKTAELVADRLRALGLDVRTGVARTGVVGVLRGGRPGPVVAVRADLDALPVTEDTPLPFRSTARATYLGQEVGVAHACGHDLHVAVQLGVAATLAALRDRVPGTVMFIFQPAEEGPPPGEDGGARLMLDEGLFAALRPAAVFALHAAPDLEVGRAGIHPGPAMAASTGWYAVVEGRQAHGARPELAVDPIVTASQVVLALQTIRARTLSPFTPSVVTVGVFRSGDRNNIIPARAELRGTIRSFDAAVTDTIVRRMHEIFEGVTRAAGASYTLALERSYPVTVNDTALVRRMRPTLERVLGSANVVDPGPTTGAEDFGWFAREAPGFYFRLGTTRPGTTSGGLHTPTFLADDGAVPVGIRVMTALVLDYLGAP
ncbi:MAG TPA: amidohydrolase [Gemmatimonadales bacterium]|nr:amidohydrolase [Gemmatimonadales bacterium]